MPQNPLGDLTGLDPKDIAQRILQKQQGKFAQSGTPGVSEIPKPGKYQSNFTDLNPKEIAKRIISKYDLQVDYQLPRWDQPPFDIAIPDKNLMLEGAAERFAQDKFLANLEAEEKATREAASVGPPAALAAQPEQYKGQMTWDETGKLIPFTGPKPPEPEAVFAQPSTRQRLELQAADLVGETPEEKEYWRRREMARDVEGMKPPRINVVFDAFAQPLMHTANAAAAGIPAVVNKVFFGENLPAPLSMAGGVGAGLGELAGLIGPAKFTTGAARLMDKANYIIGKSFIPKKLIRDVGGSLRGMTAPADVLHKVGEWATKWTPKTVGGEMLKRTMASSITMAGIYGMGEAEGENVGEIMLNKLRSMPTGVVAGQIFGLGSLANFTKLHPMTGWLIRGGAVSLGLDLLHGNHPFDERELWEKVYGYGLNAVFTKPGTAQSPWQIRNRLEFEKRQATLRKEADAIDKEMRAEGLEPVARESLEKMLRQTAETLGKPVPPEGVGEQQFLQNMQRISGEQKAATDKRNQRIFNKLEEARGLLKTEVEPAVAPAEPFSPDRPIQEGQVLNIEETLLKMNDVLSEPGKISPADKGKLQMLLWDINDALIVEKAERERMAEGGLPVAQVRKNLDRMRLDELMKKRGITSEEAAKEEIDTEAEAELAEAEERGFQAMKGKRPAAPEELWPDQVAGPNRRQNASLRGAIQRVMGGGGSAQDKLQVKDYMKRKQEGKVRPGEPSIEDMLKIDALTGLGRREQFFLEDGAEGRKFWSLDLRGMGKLNEAIGNDNVDFYLNKMGNIIRKSLPKGAQATRWGGDEILFWLDQPYGERMTQKMNKYMDDLLAELRVSTPFDGRWTFDTTALGAVEKTNAAKNASGKGTLPANFDPSKWMPRGKPSPAAVARAMEAPEKAAPKKVTKTLVKTKEDGTVEITSKAEDDIPELSPFNESKTVLFEIVRNPARYDKATYDAAYRELARRGRLEEALPRERTGDEELQSPEELESERTMPERRRREAERDAAEEAAIAKAEREADYEVEPPEASLPPEFPTQRQKFETEELRGQRVDERKRLKGLYKEKPFIAQNIIDYNMKENGLERKEAIAKSRKDFQTFKDSGTHKWESLINRDTRKRFGGGREGGGPAAPPAPVPPATSAPATGSPVSGARAREIRVDKGFPERTRRAPAEDQGEVKKAILAWEENAAIHRRRMKDKLAKGDTDVTYHKEKIKESDAQARAWREKLKAVEEEEVEGPEVPIRAEPAKPKVKPEEVIKANGEDYWGPLVEGGVPQKHETLVLGDIWIKPGGKGQNRAKIVRLDPDLPWAGDVKYNDGDMVRTDVYDLWADGFRPKGWKGKSSIGRVEVPRPVRFLTGPGAREEVSPESAPRRGSREVLDRDRALAAARINERRRAGLPVEPEPPPTSTLRGGGGFPTTRGAAVSVRPAEEGGVSVKGVAFEDVERAKPSRTYQELTDAIRSDPRYDKNAERWYDYFQDAIMRSVPDNRKDFAGRPLGINQIEDIRDKIHDMFVQYFDPSKAKQDTLKEAIRNYVSRTAAKEINRVVTESLEEQQFREGTEEGQEGEETPFGEFTEEDLIFQLSRGPKNKFDAEPFRSDAEILAEEARITEESGTPRQKLARKAFLDVRRDIPMDKQGLFAEYAKRLEFLPTGAEPSLRQMADELGIPRETVRRHISEIRESIIKTIESNPEYYDAFAKEAKTLQEYWDELAKFGKEERKRKQEEFKAQHGDDYWIFPNKLSDRYIQELRDALTHFPEVEDFDRFYQVKTDFVPAQKFVPESPTVKPEPYTGEPVERPGPSPEDVEYFRRIDRSVPTQRVGKPSERGSIDVDLLVPGRKTATLLLSRAKSAFAEYLGPKARIVANPELFELADRVKDIAEIGLDAFSDGKREVGDLIRYPWWSEKYHEVSNEMLNQEADATRVTYKAFRISKPFWRSAKESKGKILQVLEIEDMSESVITNPNSKAAIRMRAAGIKFTPEEKTAYRAIRKALDYIVIDEMPRLMSKAGFSKQEIADTIARYYREGYLPHFRFGDWVLSYLYPVKGEKGVRYRRYVESFRTKGQRDRHEATIKPYKDSKGNSHDPNFTKFRFSEMRQDPNSFVMLMEHWPVAERMFKSAAKNEYEKKAVDVVERMAKEKILGNYAKGRFAQRKGRMGWSKDYERALKDYFTHVPFSMVRRYQRSALEAKIDKLGNAKDIKYARGLHDFWSGAGMREGKPTQYVRRGIYNYFLALKGAQFLQNITQRFATHLPLAISEADTLGRPMRGIASGTAAASKAQAQEEGLYLRVLGNVGKKGQMNMESAITGTNMFSAKEKKVLLRLMESGELGALRVKESAGRSFADIRAGTSIPWKFLPSPELFATLSEKSNRLHSALTALNLYGPEGLSETKLYEKARDFIRTADFPFSKASRQRIARGFVGSNAFVLKSYIGNYVMGFMPKLYQNSKPAALTAATIWVALAGAMGVPGYQLLRGVVRSLLPGTDEEKERKMADAEDAFDEAFGGVLAHGIPALVGIDGSSWLGFQDPFNLVPISMGENIYDNVVRLWYDESIDKSEKWTRLMPSYFKHWMRMRQMNDTGSIGTDRYGAPSITPQDVQRFSSEIKDWAFEQYNKMPTPEEMDELEQALYREVGAPSLTMSRFYNRTERLKSANRRFRQNKAEANRLVAQVFVEGLQDSERVTDIQLMRQGEFTRNFWDIIHGMPEDKQQEIRDIIADYEERGLKFDAGSILNAIQERLERIRRRIND